MLSLVEHVKGFITSGQGELYTFGFVYTCPLRKQRSQDFVKIIFSFADTRRASCL